MSAQGLNGTAYKGFTTQSDNTGVNPQFPLRDGSDYTKLIRERSVYRETSAPATPSPKVILQGYQFHLSHKFGSIECAGCTAGPFTSEHITKPFGS